MGERFFGYASKMENGSPVVEHTEYGETRVFAYPDAKLPEYQTKGSAGADFFCAEEVTIPSIWTGVLWLLTSRMRGDAKEYSALKSSFSPTMVHTGINACMEEDEVLYIFNRSGNPKKLGLVLANSVGVVDSDYYGNADNDGEIMFAFYNFMPWSVTLKVGDRIGQGVFSKFLRPSNANVKNETRRGGYGSTGK